MFWWGEAEKVLEFPIPSHRFQLSLVDPQMFPSQVWSIIPPVSPRSGPGPDAAAAWINRGSLQLNSEDQQLYYRALLDCWDPHSIMESKSSNPVKERHFRFLSHWLQTQWNVSLPMREHHLYITGTLPLATSILDTYTALVETFIYCSWKPQTDLETRQTFERVWPSVLDLPSVLT